MFADLSALPRRNGRFDLDGVGFAESVVAVGAPGPVFRFFYETSLHGVAVDVLQLLDALLRSTNVEVVISRLPEMLGSMRVLGAPQNLLLVVWGFLLGERR